MLNLLSVTSGLQWWRGIHPYSRDLTVYGLYGVEQRGRLREDHGAPHHCSRPEHPEEHPVQHHGHYAPVLVLLQQYQIRYNIF